MNISVYFAALLAIVTMAVGYWLAGWLRHA